MCQMKRHLIPSPWLFVAFGDQGHALAGSPPHFAPMSLQPSHIKRWSGRENIGPLIRLKCYVSSRHVRHSRCRWISLKECRSQDSPILSDISQVEARHYSGTNKVVPNLGLSRQCVGLDWVDFTIGHLSLSPQSTDGIYDLREVDVIAHISRVLVKNDVVEWVVLVHGCSVKPHLLAPYIPLVLIGVGVEFPHQREDGGL